jgi:hypothetical protein
MRSPQSGILSGMMEYAASIMEHLAHVYPTLRKLGASRLHIGDDKMETLRRTGHGGRHILAEDDRTGRTRGRELNDPEIVVRDDIGVEPPTEIAIKLLGAIDVRDRDDDDLKLHVGRPHCPGPGRSLALHRSIAHVQLPWFG